MICTSKRAVVIVAFAGCLIGVACGPEPGTNGHICQPALLEIVQFDDEVDSTADEPCRVDVDFDVADFPYYETTLCQFREGLKSTACGGNEAGILIFSGTTGTCQAGRVLLIRMNTGLGGTDYFYDATSGEFIALLARTDAGNPTCGFSRYWPVEVDCENSIDTEVLCSL